MFQPDAYFSIQCQLEGTNEMLQVSWLVSFLTRQSAGDLHLDVKMDIALLVHICQRIRELVGNVPEHPQAQRCLLDVQVPRQWTETELSA